MKDFDYTELNHDSINFIPHDTIISAWEEDYVKMQENMIYGDSLPFSDLIERIKELNQRFRN